MYSDVVLYATRKESQPAVSFILVMIGFEGRRLRGEQVKVRVPSLKFHCSILVSSDESTSKMLLVMILVKSQAP